MGGNFVSTVIEDLFAQHLGNNGFDFDMTSELGSSPLASWI